MQSALAEYPVFWISLYNLGDVARQSSSDPNKRYYRQVFPSAELSVERATDRVPNDGWYYVIQRDQVRGKFKAKYEALSLYRSLLSRTWRPSMRSSESSAGKDAVIGAFMDELEWYWGGGHKPKQRGGDKGEDADSSDSSE